MKTIFPYLTTLMLVMLLAVSMQAKPFSHFAEKKQTHQALSKAGTINDGNFIRKSPDFIHRLLKELQQAPDWGRASDSGYQQTNTLKSTTIVSKTIEVTAGNLASLLSIDELSTITDLTLTGTIDARDIKTIRDEMTVLSSLDLSNVSISAYSGPNGTKDTTWEYPEHYIPINAFCTEDLDSGKASLTSIVFPSSLKGIDKYAFLSCNQLSGTLNLPNSLIHIGRSAFNKTAFTGDLILPSSVERIDSLAFAYCSGFDGKLKLSEKIKSIGYGAFTECTNLTGNLEIPSSVTEIGKFAFNECAGLNGTLSIGENVETIGYAAFAECERLKGDLDIPSSVTEINDYAFFKCTGFSGKLSLPSTLTYLGEYAFYYCTGLTGNLKIPESLSVIPESCFEECTGFSGSLTIPSSVDSIGPWAFYDCTGFDGTIYISENVKYIGLAAIYNCSGLYGELTLPASLETIGSYAFWHCRGLSGKLKLPSSLTSLGKYAFSGCDGLTGVSIPNSLSSVPEGAFYECYQLSGALTIPFSIDTIGGWAFYYCSGFDEILTIGESVKHIGKSAFCGCSSLTGNINLPSSVEVIDSFAFYECSTITSLSIPNSVSYIGSYCFYDCYNLQTIATYAEEPVDLSAEDAVFSGVDLNNCVLKVPKGSLNDYASANQWQDFLQITEMGTKVDEFENNLLGDIAVSKGSIYITIPDADLTSKMSIYSLNGQKIFQQNILSGSTKVEMEHGIYLIQLNRGARTQTKKIVLL